MAVSCYNLCMAGRNCECGYYESYNGTCGARAVIDAITAYKKLQNLSSIENPSDQQLEEINRLERLLATKEGNFPDGAGDPPSVSGQSSVQCMADAGRSGCNQAR